MPLAAAAPPRDYRAEFPIFRRSIYLNSCSLGALCTRSRARVDEYLDLWETRGASAWYEIWWAALAELRARYARWIGAPEGSIALHANISTALTAVAESLAYRHRPKVVVTSLDFPTLAYQWLARAGDGIEVVVVESPDGITVPVEAIARAVDGRTALVATSHVFFTSGAVRTSALADLGSPPRRCSWWTATRRRDSSRWTCGRSTPTSTAAAGSSGCSAGPAWHSCTRVRSCGHAGPARERVVRAPRQFRFDPRSLGLHEDARRLEATPPLMPVAQLGGLELLEAGAEIRRRTMALAEI
jgi:hypothetical protein